MISYSSICIRLDGRYCRLPTGPQHEYIKRGVRLLSSHEEISIFMGTRQLHTACKNVKHG